MWTGLASSKVKAESVCGLSLNQVGLVGPGPILTSTSVLKTN